MSDTPRTDACEVRFSTLFAGEDAMWVPSKKAKEIERDLNEANERMSRLIKAGDAILENGSVSERLANEWNKAKGTK